MQKLTIKECKEICKMEGEKIIDVDIYANGKMANVLTLTKNHMVNKIVLVVENDDTVHYHMNIMDAKMDFHDFVEINRNLYK